MHIKSPRKATPYTASVKLRIRRLIRNGVALDELSNELNVPIESVNRHISSNREYYYGN